MSTAITKTVSLPSTLWEAVDGHAVTESATRSAVIREAVEEKMKNLGKYPDNHEADARRKFETLIGSVGPKAVADALNGITQNA